MDVRVSIPSNDYKISQFVRLQYLYFGFSSLSVQQLRLLLVRTTVTVRIKMSVDESLPKKASFLGGVVNGILVCVDIQQYKLLLLCHHDKAIIATPLQQAKRMAIQSDLKLSLSLVLENIFTSQDGYLTSASNVLYGSNIKAGQYRFVKNGGKKRRKCAFFFLNHGLLRNS